MNAFLRAYFARLARRYPDEVEHNHARAIILISSGMVLLVTLAFVLDLTVGLFPNSQLRSQIGVLTVLAGLTLFVIFWLINRGGLNLAGQLFVAIFFVVGGFLLFITGITFVAAAFILISTLVAGLLFDTRGVLFNLLASILLVAVAAIWEINRSGAVQPIAYSDSAVLSGTVVLLVMLALTGLALWLFSGNLQNSLLQYQRTARQLRTVSDIAQAANATLDSALLLPQLVEMVRDRMAFYHVQIFLNDAANANAVLVASTGEAGEQLLARGHSLPVGSQSVIGQVTARGSTVYATDTSGDPVHRANEFLPETRSEIALPLWDGAQVIGALDVQSARPDAFSEHDIETLEVMANQISVSIRNSHLFEQLRGSLEENRRLYEQTQQTLQQVERLNRQLTGQAWGEYLADIGREPGIELGRAGIKRAVSWTPALKQAVREGRAVVAPEGDLTTVAIPVDIRGQTLGAIEVDLPPGGSRDDALELIEAVSARLALALDNNRLFEEARTLAQQEHMINEIGGRLQQTSDVDAMLQVALKELVQVLGADFGAVRLQSLTEGPEREA